MFYLFVANLLLHCDSTLLYPPTETHAGLSSATCHARSVARLILPPCSCLAVHLPVTYFLWRSRSVCPNKPRSAWSALCVPCPFHVTSLCSLHSVFTRRCLCSVSSLHTRFFVRVWISDQPSASRSISASSSFCLDAPEYSQKANNSPWLPCQNSSNTCKTSLLKKKARLKFEFHYSAYKCRFYTYRTIILPQKVFTVEVEVILSPPFLLGWLVSTQAQPSSPGRRP